MTREQAINYLKSSAMSEEQIKTVINALTCEDAISREEAILHISERLYETAMNNQGYKITMDKACEDIAVDRLKTWINELPSVTPKFTDTEIQKMQELEQAQLEKAYELGRAEVQPYDDAISRAEALKHSHIEYDDDGEGHRVIYAEDIKDLPSVTPKTSEDYISKAVLLARIDEERKHLLDLKMDGAEHILVHHARRIIEDMPTVAGSEGKNDLQ